MTDLFRLEAVEVVRRGRRRWDVVCRYPDAIDTCLNQPYWFRRAAVRHARRVAAEATHDQDVVVARFEAGRPS